MSSSPRNVHMNLSAPMPERRDALAALQWEHRPTASDMPHMHDVQSLVDVCLQSYETNPIMTKGGIPSNASTAFGYGRPSDRGPGGAHSILVSDRAGLGMVGHGGYRMRPSLFQAEQLRLMVEHTPLLNAVIGRRERTVMRFLRPAERDRDVGFEIRREDDERPLRVNDSAEERLLTKFVLHSGSEFHPIRMRQLRRDTLTAFVKKSVRDLLTLDAWAIETVMSRNRKQLAGYYAVDAGTIFLASEEGYMGDDQVVAVQLIQGMATTTYTAEELIYLSMNPRTDILHHGYGYPPTEMIVRVVTGYLNALTYNLRGFDSNSIPKGILTLFGSYGERELIAFKQQWNAMVSGVNNAWKLPVLTSDGKEAAAHFEKLGVEFNEMYFAKWMVLLTSIVCAIYGMDPSEVYSESFTAGRSSLSGSDRAEALADARDTGLEPLLTFIENAFTDHLLPRVMPGYKFRFFGLQPVDRDWRKEMIKMTSTVNEAREADGREPHADPIIGNAPLNPSLSSIYYQIVQKQLAAQDQAQAGEGMPDEVSGEPDEGQGAEEPEEESSLAESGDREALPEEVPIQAAESGDRETQEASTGDFQHNPETAQRDRWFGASSMRKAWTSNEVVVI